MGIALELRALDDLAWHEQSMSAWFRLLAQLSELVLFGFSGAVFDARLAGIVDAP